MILQRVHFFFGMICDATAKIFWPIVLSVVVLRGIILLALYGYHSVPCIDDMINRAWMRSHQHQPHTRTKWWSTGINATTRAVGLAWFDGILPPAIVWDPNSFGGVSAFREHTRSTPQQTRQSPFCLTGRQPVVFPLSLLVENITASSK